ncbi:CpsD/CapB family tyrosine-protein kinase [Pseudomarimonas salicorniae]|uniref:CpsD/CapB family tyrosine-protein kinase n=1 Tax=Pseudomarimonas salicorniae TaxID=2933270 RepID=A0ABT0GHH0_9GAMM|nr:CpsD/CapB family tyrosine-protein kinase [Lysobacter sp. CAU 1642]MCK7593992.1 CpsD/CapB family tyrosine-protein kinase [Lysobacter sp. CAU 1642]
MSGNALSRVFPGALSPTDSFSGGQLRTRRIISHDMADPRPADAFRDLRTQLLAHHAGNSVILVAAVQRGNGGSFVALNLASAVAFDESRCAVLIDCNLRAPQLHERLAVDPKKGGLVDYLEGRVESLSDVVYPTGVARLMLVPAGGRREASGELLGSQRMVALLDSLRAADASLSIVLDGPAVSSSPDARILSQVADQSVLVAGYGRDTPTAVREAAAVFDPARMAGLVFNRVP